MTETLHKLYGDLPRVTAMPHPSFEEYEAGLMGWQQRWPDRITVEARGLTLEGRAIYMARVTDHDVPDDDKQVLLLSAAHGEQEISSICGILHFLKWLLSENPQAARLRRGLIVVTMALVEVDTYIYNRDTGDTLMENKAGEKIYGGLTWDGVSQEANHPEAEAFCGMMEEYQPDAHFDIHGLAFRDYGMQESLDSGTPRISRCFDPTIIADIERALDEAGYPVIRDGVQAGRLCVACRAAELGAGAQSYLAMPEQTDASRLMITPVILSYHRYHSISFTCELFWMGSIMVACRRLAEIGLEVGFSEFFPGYPNNLVEHRNNLLISAWGDTAARRRRSRVELWRRSRSGLSLQNGGPMVLKDTMLASCATTVQGQRLLGIDPDIGVGEGRERFIANISNDERFNAQVLRSFLDDFPPTRFDLGTLTSHGGPVNVNAPRQKEYPPIQHGLAMRVCLPHAEDRVKEVRHNGHLLNESPTDGYLVHHRQGTVVQVNIPPEKVHDLHVVTIRYDAGPRPPQGFAPEDWAV